MKRLRLVRGLLSSALVAAVVACQAGGDNEEDIGVAELTLLNVPADVACVRVKAAGTRVVEDEFDVTPGEASTYSLRGLPLGTVLFSAETFPVACSSVSSELASWVGGPVSEVLQGGVVSQVTVPMRRNGRADVGLDFDDPTCSPEGGSCTVDDNCCGGPNLTASCQEGSCVQTCSFGFSDCNGDKALDGCEANLFNDIDHCGACGLSCELACDQAACLDSTLTVDGITYLGHIMAESITSDGITAPLVHGGLCDTTNTAWANQIVLCQRGLILFSDKGNNVANSGGLAAVVYNNVPGRFRGVLVEPVPVPVVSLSQEDGEFLVANKLGSTATLVAH